MANLLMVAPAPVMETPQGLLLDIKFVEGARAHARCWDGPVEFVLWRGHSSIPFGAVYDPSQLGFGLRLLDAGVPVPEALLEGQDVVCASADMTSTFDIVLKRRKPRPKVVYVIEYTHRTRMDILRLDRSKTLPRRLYSAAKLMTQERRRRLSFRKADGIQANGYPAYEVYRGLNSNILLYLDNRMKPGMFGTPDEMASRASRLRSGAALRIVHSGRLEPMKGAQDILPFAKQLVKADVEFTLDVFGTGSLETGIRKGIETEGLLGRVRLHGALDFESELVPWQRRNADVYLSCHRQGDPSCTYLESMGCGLPILGYQNEMWRNLAETCRGGWAVALGDTDALAQKLKSLSRDDIVGASEKALAFATAHDFDREFRLRMNHLASLLE